MPEDVSPTTQTTPEATAGDPQTPPAAQPSAPDSLPDVATPVATSPPLPTDLGPDPSALEHMLDLPLDVTVELGRATMQLGEALALQPGSIIELNRLPGEPLDMHINERLVARGEVVVVNDVLGLRITEIIRRDVRGR